MKTPALRPGLRPRNFIVFFLTFMSFNSLIARDWENPAERYMNIYKQYEDAECPLPDDGIAHFVYFARDREALRNHEFLSNIRFQGAQIMYPWRHMEPSRGVYDFSAIREDMDYLAGYGKTLFVQLQDASFFMVNIPVPDYLRAPEFDGGIIEQRTDSGKTEGWVAKRWNSAVRERFARLIEALGEDFDGRIAGLNLQESAIGVTREYDASFTPEAYLEGLKENMTAAARAFSRSPTLQYANFMPGEWLPWDDKGYLRSIYAHGEAIGAGLGAPDLMVRRKGQLNHALAMMHEGRFGVPLGIAVQEGNYIGETGNTRVVKERKNSVPLLRAFADDFLGVSFMFWSYQEPYFSEDVLSCIQ